MQVAVRADARSNEKYVSFSFKYFAYLPISRSRGAFLSNKFGIQYGEGKSNDFANILKKNEKCGILSVKWKFCGKFKKGW